MRPLRCSWRTAMARSAWTRSPVPPACRRRRCMHISVPRISCSPPSSATPVSRRSHLAELLPTNATDVRAALTAFGGGLLRFFLEDRALAIHRVVIGESTRFPELGRAFYDNGPAALFRTFGAWLTEQTEAGRLAVTDSDHGIGAVRRHAADQPVPARLGRIDATNGCRDRRHCEGGGDDLSEGLFGALARLRAVSNRSETHRRKQHPQSDGTTTLATTSSCWACAPMRTDGAARAGPCCRRGCRPR